MIFYSFVFEEKLISKEDIENVLEFEIMIEEYLKGMIDFTNELNRMAVIKATLKEKASIIKMKEVVNTIYEGMLNFDLRNSDLRRK